MGKYHDILLYIPLFLNTFTVHNVFAVQIYCTGSVHRTDLMYTSRHKSHHQGLHTHKLMYIKTLIY